MVDKEYRDWKELEGLSAKGLFMKVLGTKEDKLEIEKQEYLQAVLELREHEKSIELLNFEYKVVLEKIQNKSKIEQELKDLMKSREAEIMRGNHPLSKEVLMIEKEIEGKFGMKREIHEALIAGAKALNLLNKMISSLQKAGEWGAYAFHGRGYKYARQVRSSIDNALDLTPNVKNALVDFEEELADVYGEKARKLSLRLNHFERFSSNFFDSLISDWTIRQSIQDGLRTVFSKKDKVMRINQSLRQELSQVDTAINYLEQKKADKLKQL